jgi:hypothetical protein
MSREGKLVPTQKGLSISVRKLPELYLAIGRALREARARGMLRDTQ